MGRQFFTAKSQMNNPRFYLMQKLHLLFRVNLVIYFISQKKKKLVIYWKLTLSKMICICSSFLMLMSVMVFSMQRFAIWQISLCFFESGLWVYKLLKVSYWIRIMHLLVESHYKWDPNIFYVDENYLGVGFARARVLVHVDVVESWVLPNYQQIYNIL